MNFKRSGYLAFILLLISWSFGCSDEAPAVAQVGEYSITLDDFRARYTDFLISAGLQDNPQTRLSILNNMINEVLLLHYDDNESIYNRLDYQKELKWTKNQVLLGYLKDQEVFAKLTATEEEVRVAFLRSNQKIAARHLYAPTLKEANNLYDRLQNGESFDDLAKEVFTDTTLKNNGGFLGYFSWGDMDPAFEDTAFALKKGVISKPVKTAQGYSIIKVEDKITHPVLTETEFQKNKDHMSNTVRLRKKGKSEKEYLSKIMQNLSISFNEDGIARLFEYIRQNNDYVEQVDELDRDAPCLSLNDKEYTCGEIFDKVEYLPAYHEQKIDSERKLQTVIKGIFIQESLLDSVYQKGYDELPVVKKMLKKGEEKVFLQFKITEILRDVDFPDSVMKKYYYENLNVFTAEDQINVQEIIVYRKSLADSLFTDLQTGKDFATLALKHSLRRWSAENGGIMGYAAKSKFGDLADIFWNAEIGEVLGVHRLDDKFGIFKVLGKIENDPVPFELIKDQVKKAMVAERQSSIIRNYVDQLHKEVEITIEKDILTSFEI